MRTLFLILVCCYLIPSSLFANFRENGYVIFNNGDTLTGLVYPFVSNDTKIKFQESAIQSKEKIKSSHLIEIGLIDKLDTLKFHDYQLVKYNLFGKLVKIRGHCWANRNFHTSKIEAYQFWMVRLQSVPIIDAFSAFPFVYNQRDVVYGLRFPGMDEIILLDASRKGPKKFKTPRVRRRLTRYMKKHCKKFNSSIDDDKAELKSMYDYLVYYYKTCK